MTSSSSNSSMQAPRIDAAQRKCVPTSGTILFVLTFALWFSRFIGSHQFSQGKLVTIVITSLLAKNPAFQHPTSTVLLLCYTGFFSARDYCFLKFACLSSPQMLWGVGKKKKLYMGCPPIFLVCHVIYIWF
jgi:hypothetical protein